MFGKKKSFSSPKCLNTKSCFQSKFSQEKVLVLRKLFRKKCCKNSKMQAEACFETKTTKILALNTKFRKKSLASKLKGLLKSVALNPDSRKVLFRNEKVY